MENKYTTEAESLRLCRRALAERLHELHLAAVAQGQAHKFRKGDVVYRVNLYRTSGTTDVATVVAHQMKLTSLGKRQGTATHVENGQNILSQVSPTHDILFATVAEVEAYAAQIGPLATEESHLGAAYCELVNRPNLYPKFVATCDANVAAHLVTAEAARYKVSIQAS